MMPESSFSNAVPAAAAFLQAPSLGLMSVAHCLMDIL
jgi:hypothetical protein